MTLEFPSAAFDDAVASVCHGRASDGQLEALNRLLRENPAARDEYLLRIELHARLASEPDLLAPMEEADRTEADDALANGCGTADFIPTSVRGGLFATASFGRRDAAAPRLAPPDSMVERGERRPGEAHPRGPRKAVSPGRWAKSSPIRRRVAWGVALAAGFALIAAGAFRWFHGREAARPAGSAVAMLTRTVDVRWARGATVPRVGGALEPGWLRLESGLAQVVFHSGARLELEGPAELQLVSSGEAVISTGRLLAEVPPPARGFRLRTGQADVVDRGTAFGVDASRTRTEVHVFQGRVEVRAGNAPMLALGETQAAVVDGSAPMRLQPASGKAFAALFDFQQRHRAAEAFRYEQWQFANARWNQDPSLVVHLDFQDLGGADWTLRNVAADRAAVPEATIVGGQRGQGRWREKHALEFQGVNDRVRLTVPGEFASLTLSGWFRVASLERPFNSLFMCDGFAPGTLHWLIRGDGVLGLTVFGEGAGEFQILASPPVITPDALGLWLHLAVVLDGASREVIHYVNGAAVARHGLRYGPPFRLDSAELGNWNAHGGSPAAPDLIRNLSGAIDEFELFDRALSAAELRELYLQGKPDA